MDKYRRIEKVKETVVKDDDEIRVTAVGSVAAYVTRAATVYTELNKEQVVIKASGNALTRAVTLAEVVKRRFKGLHQITSVGLTEIVDEYEPLEEGLDKVTDTRSVAIIEIKLSKTPLDTTHPGYQPPIDESLVTEFDPEQLTKPRGRGRGKGRGKGRGASKGKGKAKGKSKGKSREVEEEEEETPSKGKKGKGKGKGKEKAKVEELSKGKGKGKGKGKADAAAPAKGKGKKGKGYKGDSYESWDDYSNAPAKGKKGSGKGGKQGKGKSWENDWDSYDTYGYGSKGGKKGGKGKSYNNWNYDSWEYPTPKGKGKNKGKGKAKGYGY